MKKNKSIQDKVEEEDKDDGKEFRKEEVCQELDTFLSRSSRIASYQY